jgi:predicted transposase YbfD/YdcC
LVLGQRKVSAKSNEITAIPELLKILTIEGTIVSIDAMGCQKEIAQTIIEQKGDYVLALKGNHPNLYQDVVQLFEFARQQDWKGIEHQFYQTSNKDHGRLEIRRHWTMGNTEYLYGAEQWKGLQSIGMVESERRVKDKITVEQRYYLMSIESDAQHFAESFLKCKEMCAFALFQG